MLCCLTGLAIAGKAAMASGPALAASRWRLPALACLAAAGLAIMTLVSEHAGHYADRARANDRSVIAELFAQPLCSGSRITS
jgi:hypothetical protein